MVFFRAAHPSCRAETTDAIGPLGAKSMSESPFNPVAPALADALRGATGVRFTELPLLRDAVRPALTEHHAAGAAPGTPSGRRPPREGAG